MATKLIPCNCECHEAECHADHGFNGAYSAYCSGCESIYEYQVECGCCLNADIGEINGPGAIHRAVAILATVEMPEDDRVEALAQLECDATRLVHRSVAGASVARDLVSQQLEALELAA